MHNMMVTCAADRKTDTMKLLRIDPTILPRQVQLIVYARHGRELMG